LTFVSAEYSALDEENRCVIVRKGTERMNQDCNVR